MAALAREGSGMTPEDERAIAKVFGTFLPPAKPPRRKPNRCRECGRVTRYIFCPECNKRRAAERGAS